MNLPNLEMVPSMEFAEWAEKEGIENAPDQLFVRVMPIQGMRFDISKGVPCFECIQHGRSPQDVKIEMREAKYVDPDGVWVILLIGQHEECGTVVWCSLRAGEVEGE